MIYGQCINCGEVLYLGKDHNWRSLKYGGPPHSHEYFTYFEEIKNPRDWLSSAQRSVIRHRYDVVRRKLINAAHH